MWRRRAHRLLDMSRPRDDILTAQTREDLSADLLPEWSEHEWVLVQQEQYRTGARSLRGAGAPAPELPAQGTDTSAPAGTVPA